MDNEGVLKVLHGTLHPVVERRRPLGELQVQLVDGFQQLLSSLLKNERPEKKKKTSEKHQAKSCAAARPSMFLWRKMTHKAQLLSHLQGFAAFLGQRAQLVPVVADPLAASVDIAGVVVVQIAKGQRDKDQCWREI